MLASMSVVVFSFGGVLSHCYAAADYSWQNAVSFAERMVQRDLVLQADYRNLQ